MNSARPPDSIDAAPAVGATTAAATTAAATAAAETTAAGVAAPLVEHEPGRFWMRVDGHLCVADYRRGHAGPASGPGPGAGPAEVIDIVHTEVPSALQGRGLAAVLMQTLLAWARTEGLHVRPICSYARSYMRRHADTQDLLAR